MNVARLAPLLILVACSRTTSTPIEHRAPPKTPACLADALGPLRHEIPDFTCGNANTCDRSCAAGDPSGCFTRATQSQGTGDHAKALDDFALACKLGLALGCTNYAATIWTLEKPGATRACVRMLFDRACGARDPWGCGMLGRMLATYAKTESERSVARAHFDRVCNDVAGVTCRMYAYHLELGQLGTVDPATPKALLLRACDTGDHEACDVETASETFH
jgi:hypothetical protein